MEEKAKNGGCFRLWRDNEHIPPAMSPRWLALHAAQWENKDTEKPFAKPRKRAANGYFWARKMANAHCRLWEMANGYWRLCKTEMAAVGRVKRKRPLSVVGDGKRLLSVM